MVKYNSNTKVKRDRAFSNISYNSAQQQKYGWGTEKNERRNRKPV